MSTQDARIALTLGAVAIVITVVMTVYNLYESGVKAGLYKECLKTNEQIAAKAVEKSQMVHTITCYYR